MKKIYISYSFKLIVHFIILVLLLFFSVLYIKKSYYYTEDIAIKNETTTTANYKVYVKKSDFYNIDYIDEDKYYISNIINYFLIDFRYMDLYPEITNFNYKYTITNVLNIYSSSNSILYTQKDEVCLNESKGYDSFFNILEETQVDFKKYKRLVEKYKSEYGVNVSADLNVLFDVESYSKDFDNSSQASVTIPLTSQIFNIKKNSPGIVTSSKVLSKKDIIISDWKSYYIGVILIVLFFIICVKTWFYIHKLSSSKTKYEILLKKYLRQFDRLIVKLKSPISTENCNVIDVVDFKELLDVRDNLEKPILFYEIQKNQKCVFIIMAENDKIYRYVLKSADI